MLLIGLPFAPNHGTPCKRAALRTKLSTLSQARPSPSLPRRPPPPRRSPAVAALIINAAAASPVQPDAATGNGSSVYFLRMPLVGLEALGAVLKELYPPVLDHYAVVVSQPGMRPGDPSRPLVVCFDFLPDEPAAPATAAALLAGGSVRGRLRRQQLQFAPRQRCELLGPAAVSDAIAAADAFLAEWDPRLVIGERDCRTFAAALATRLVGREVELAPAILHPGKWKW